jgi:hypothetical protein
MLNHRTHYPLSTISAIISRSSFAITRKRVGKLRKKKKPSKWKSCFLIILLAAVCIGGVELAVCRYADPALYQKVTTPVLEQAGVLREKLVAAQKEVQAWKDGLWKTQEEESLESLEQQVAGSPAIWTDPTTVDHTLTALENRGEKEVLTGGTRDIIYYNQGDPTWSQKPYGSDTIGGYGCGPTVMAMAISSLSDQSLNPEDMAQWAKDNRHWAKGRGSSLSIVEGAASAFGLQAQACRTFDAKRLHQELASGNLMVALMTKGHFTQGGHFILLRGATLDGGILVADPSSRDRSLMVWDAQVILNELSRSRANGAPLWIISTPGKDAD